MKIRRSVLLFVVMGVLLIALIIWFGKRPYEGRLGKVSDTNDLRVFAQEQTTEQNQPDANMRIRTNMAIVKTISSGSTSPPTKGEQAQGILSTYNDVPIVFYGKIEDQFSNAVVNAIIGFSIRVYNGTESTVKRGQVTTDANGLFTITGYKGQDLGVVPQKKGYVLATSGNGTLFKYSRMEDHPYVSDPNDPAIIKMWKLRGAEPLMGIDQHYKIHLGNDPIYFDLLAGKIVASGGDVKITVNRPSGIISERNPQDWGVNVEAIKGGLMESLGQSSVTYWAPETGYQLSETATASSNHHGVGVIQQSLFIQSRNGQVYSKLSLTFGINSTPEGFISVTFSGVANTNSSRNWEATVPQTMQ